MPKHKTGYYEINEDFDGVDYWFQYERYLQGELPDGWTRFRDSAVSIAKHAIDKELRQCQTVNASDDGQEESQDADGTHIGGRSDSTGGSDCSDCTDLTGGSDCSDCTDFDRGRPENAHSKGYTDLYLKTAHLTLCQEASIRLATHGPDERYSAAFYSIRSLEAYANDMGMQDLWEDMASTRALWIPSSCERSEHL